MRLYESYDAITDDMVMMNEEVPDGDVFKSDPWFRKTTKMQSVVNGNYFRYDAGSYIRGISDKTHKTYIYDKTLLDASLFSFLDRLAKMMTMMTMDEREPSSEVKKQYLLAEFLIMCTSYNYPNGYTDNPDVNRRNSMPYYLEPITAQNRHVVFDITAVFSNMINIRYTYERYESFFSFFKYSDSHEWTLLGRLKNDVKKVRSIEDYNSEYHAIASDAIIRNSDVLLSLTEMMESNSPSTLAYGPKGAVSRYRLFLEGLVDTNMKTYRVGADGEPYELHYSFIQTLSKVLDEVPEENLLEILHSSKDANDDDKARTGIYIGEVKQ